MTPTSSRKNQQFISMLTFQRILVLIFYLFGSATSIFQLEESNCTEMQSNYFSPLARHRIEEFDHFLIYLVHDISSFFTIVLFLYLWQIGNSNPNHKYFGRLLFLPLSIAIISGFLLIHKRSVQSDLTRSVRQLYTVTLQTQGWNLFSISINAFLMKTWLCDNRFNILILMLHMYDFYLGLKSFWLLLSIIFHRTGNPTDNLFVETSVNLLFIMSLPQLLNELTYIWIHFWNRRQSYSNFNWTAHHNMSVFFLSFMSVPGVFFSFAHDKYWVFYPDGIRSAYLRAAVMMTPMLILLAINLPMVIRSANSHFEKSPNSSS